MKENKTEGSMTLREAKKELNKFFVTMLCISIVIVVLFETGVLDYWKGEYAGMKNFEFIVLTVMEVLTIASIPFALKLLKMKFVKRKFDAAEDRVTKYKELSLIRMEILIMPMIINIFCYYLFMQTSFGYMAIIQLICLCFVCPTMSRCEREAIKEPENGEQQQD
ncbi:MAG: hypothetical protein MJZ08_00145 [Bacteroidaceae bacterium]|nr:hypothetical protein [Bacteroidaceae bacterium]